MKYDNGYYWANYGGRWVVALARNDGRFWELPGNNRDFEQKDFTEIGERIFRTEKSLSGLDHIIQNCDPVEVAKKCVASDPHGSYTLEMYEDLIRGTLAELRKEGHAEWERHLKRSLTPTP